MNRVLILLAFTFTGQLKATTTAFECKPKVDNAREALLELMGGNISVDQQSEVKESANIANSCLMDLAISKGKEEKVADLKKTWIAFKNTRENELVPLILAGKKEEAKKIGTGIQSERIGKIKALLYQLNSD